MATAPEIVSHMLNDPSAYRAAAAAEAKVWAEQFADPAAKSIRAEDQAAAARLRPARQGRDFRAVASERGWRFSRGLSLACGAGFLERELVACGYCDSFVGVDVSSAVLDEARRDAAGLAIEYREGDLNSLELGSEEFDLVIAQNCLHHVLKLEFLAEEIRRCLKPGGVLWIDDFIGETQFQWDDRRLRIANDILAVLPERYRRLRLHDFILEEVRRPPPGELASPFEAIRSSEIVPIFSRHFEIEWRNEFDSLVHLLCPVGGRLNYVETDDGPVIFELLLLLDRLLVENGILGPVAGQYVMRKRS